MGAKSQGFWGKGGLSKGLNRNFGTTLGSVFVRDKKVCVQLGKPQYGGTKVQYTVFEEEKAWVPLYLF